MTLAIALVLLFDQAEVLVKGPPPQTLKGEVVRENLKGIVLKSGEKPVMIPWREVDQVNGRPVAEHVAKLRTSLKESFCVDCRGGLVALVCPDCLGTAKVYSKTVPCPDCNKTGLSGKACTRGCDKGTFRCPGPCVKKGVGPWKNVPGHGPSIVFIYPKGVMGVSEKHAGQVWEYKETSPWGVCLPCVKDGKPPCRECREAGTFVKEPPKHVGDCDQCGGPTRGAGRIPCTDCAGGTLPCGTCAGTKVLPVPESAGACATCQNGLIRCVPCGDTGIFDARNPGKGPVPGIVTSVRPDLRKAFEKLDETRFAPLDRVRLRDGRALEGSVLHVMTNGIVLVYREGPDLRALPILTKHGWRRERLSSPSPVAKPPEPASDAPKPPDPAKPPPAGPDTVVLKDGTTVNGKVIGKSELLVIVQTPDGKLVKIESDKVLEIRKASK